MKPKDVESSLDAAKRRRNGRSRLAEHAQFESPSGGIQTDNRVVEIEQILAEQRGGVSVGEHPSGLFDTPDGLKHGVVDEIVAGQNTASTGRERFTV